MIKKSYMGNRWKRIIVASYLVIMLVIISLIIIWTDRVALSIRGILFLPELALMVVYFISLLPIGNLLQDGNVYEIATLKQLFK